MMQRPAPDAGDAIAVTRWQPAPAPPPDEPAAGWTACRRANVKFWLLIARGDSNKLIARELDIAETTVKIHVQHILRKLNLSSRVQAAVFAVNGTALTLCRGWRTRRRWLRGIVLSDAWRLCRP
jgi:DNA-binding CsgD family transcriptional regulator